MSAIKAIFSIFVILLFIIASLIFQIYFAFETSVFSTDFFTKALDSSSLPSSITQYAFSSLNNIELKGENGETSTEGTIQIRELTSILNTHIDKYWLETQLSTLMKGFHAYMFSDVTQLPELDIRPVKSAFIEIITQQALQHSNISDSDEMYELAESEFSKRMKFEDIKDTLDLNLLVEKVFDKEYNYPAGVKKIISVTRKALIMNFSIILALLIFILVFMHFRPKSILRWCASAFWAAGLPVLALGMAAANNPSVKEAVNSIRFDDKLNNQPEFVNAIQTIINTFLSGFTKHLVIISLILVLLGVLCIALSFLKLHKSPVEPPKHKAIIRVLRSFAVLAAFLLIPVTVIWSYSEISDTVIEFKSHVESSSSPLESLDIFKVLAETTGAEFLKESYKNVPESK